MPKKGIFGLGRLKPDVLIVDDDDGIREVVRTMLEGGSFGQIFEAANGEKAIDIAYKERPHLIVLDYMMPGMDGEAVAKAIGRMLPDTRIVSFSAVLGSQPAWADAHVAKTDISRLVPILEAEADALPR